MQAESRNPLVRYMHWLHARWPAGTVERLPEVQAISAPVVPGVYIVGDLTGIRCSSSPPTPAPAPSKTIDADARFQDQRKAAPPMHELIIIGAGWPAWRRRWRQARPEVCHRRSDRFFDRGELPRGKPIYTYPGDDPGRVAEFHAEVKEGARRCACDRRDYGARRAR